MFGFGKGKRPPTDRQSSSAKPATDHADATAGFPRGLPDGDPYKPAATGQWPSADDIAGFLPEWTPGMFLLGRDLHGRYYGHADDRHILTVAGSRAGKGVSLIVPNLLFWPGSVIAIDPKGELASITASRRSGLGSKWSVPLEAGKGKVYALDPFDRVTGEAKQFAQAAFNPMSGLDPFSDGGCDRAYQIADALIIQAEGEGAFWTQSARAMLRALILYVAITELPANAHLLRVRALTLQKPDDRKAMFERMGKINHDIVGRMGNAMQGRGDREIGSIMGACDAQTTFLEGDGMKRVLCGSTFQMEDLKSERITVYLCLPATRLETHGRWLRLVVSMAIEAMEKTGPLERGKPPVLFCLDEFAALGRMESIEKAAGQIASFGVKLWTIIQDISQIKRDYKDGWETFMGNAGLLTFWGNTDVTTSEHIEKRLGDTQLMTAVINETKTWTDTNNRASPLLIMLTGQAGPTGNVAAARGGNQTRSQQVVRAPLMSASEIVRCFARETNKLLVFIPDKPPLALFRCAYFDEKTDGKMFGGLYDHDEVPGQKPPHTNRARREELNAGG